MPTATFRIRYLCVRFITASRTRRLDLGRPSPRMRVGAQFTVVTLAVITSMGIAGIPAASLPKVSACCFKLTTRCSVTSTPVRLGIDPTEAINEILRVHVGLPAKRTEPVETLRESLRRHFGESPGRPKSSRTPDAGAGTDDADRR